MQYIELAWIRQGDQLILGSNVEELLGWTAEEAAIQPLESLMTPATWDYFKQNYYHGPPDKIRPLVFSADLVHRGGHIVCARVFIVCRYDEEGEMCEAWGSLRSCQNQHTLNCLLTWWPIAEEEEVNTLARIVEAYIAA